MINLNHLFGFAFTRRNISCRTLYSLKEIDHRYLLWGKKSIDKYLEILLKEQPEYILGLGIYTGRDQSKIRIETKCITPSGKELVISPFLKPGINSVLTETIGHSYCNLVSWKIMSLINSGKLKSQYTFLHLPKTMDIKIAVSEVEKLITGG